MIMTAGFLSKSFFLEKNPCVCVIFFLHWWWVQDTKQQMDKDIIQLAYIVMCVVCSV